MRRDTSRSTDDASRNRPPTDTDADRTSADTRRSFLRTVGATAALGAGAAGASGTPTAAQDGAVAPWEVELREIDEWSLTTTETSAEAVEAGPTVETDGDALLVSGATEFPRSGCDDFAPTYLSYDPETGKVGVEIDTFARHELDDDTDVVVCGDSIQYLGYELRIVPAGEADSVIVDEAFSDDGRVVEVVGDPGPDVHPSVADYEWTLEPQKYTDPAWEEPTAEFDGDQLVVEGYQLGGADRCLTPVLRRLTFADAALHDFEVETGFGENDDVMPHEGCFDAEIASRYELVVTFEDELPPHVSVIEEGRHTTSLASPDVPLTAEGVESYDYQAEWAPTDLQDEPAISFDGNTVTLRGRRTFASTGCRAVAPRRVAFDDRSGHLGVSFGVVDTTRVCLHAVGDLVYTLTLELSEDVRIATVEEQFAETTREVHYADDHAANDLPAEIVEYDLSQGESVSPTDAEEIEPSVERDGDDVVVEGALAYGSPSCHEIGLDEVARRDTDGNHVEVSVAARSQPDHMPYESCDDDLAAARYELRLTPAADAEVDYVSVVEAGRHGSDRGTYEVPDDADRGPPEELLDYELLTDRDVDDAHAVEDDPSISFERPAEDAPDEAVGVVVVEGAVRLSSGSCDTVGLTDASGYWEPEIGDPFVVRVESVRRDDYEEGTDCTTDAPPVQYELRLLVDDLPGEVRAEEGSDEDGEPLRSASTYRSGCETAVEIDGEAVCDVSGDGLYRDVTADDSVGQTDVIAFFERQHRAAWKRPELFDFTGNGSVGHSDVIDLFRYVATQ